MLEKIDVFSTAPEIRGYQGSTFPIFRIPVSGIIMTENYTMRLVIEQRYKPGNVAATINCTRVQDGFVVRLTTLETRNLCGSYLMHFILNDGAYWEYRNLVVPLEVLPSPEEVEE